MDEADRDGGARVPEGVATMIDRVGDILAAERVVGTPIERDGATLVPVVSVRGGGGGGGGGGTAAPREARAGGADRDSGSGAGLGFGVMARPVGAYAIENGVVRWVPAVDVSRIALIALAVFSMVFRALESGRRSRGGRR
jgi:uncharacterized spore protein YtfJ